MSILHVVSFSSGKDSTATLLIALARFGAHRVLVIFCDTGNEHEEVYRYLDYIELALGVKVVRLRANFEAEISSKRMFVARDRRTRRQYDRVPRTDAQGNVVYRRLNNGDFELQLVWTRSGWDVVGVPRLVKRHGRKVRWTNKGNRRAMRAMVPSGNPFLDLCIWKGRFPSRKAQFCTEELKRNMAVSFQLELMEAGHIVVSWQGVRRDESANRRHVKSFEKVAPGLFLFRPIADKTAAWVFSHCAAAGIKPNPLYLQGMGRVGCMPCINCGKAELREIAARWPEHPERISEWEHIVGDCSKRGYSTFMADAHPGRDRREVFADLNIWSRIEWSKTTRGGQQYDLLGGLETGCASSYGLCDGALGGEAA
ncbi:MAG: phosphoadenosine phosphosulfate reductase [Rubrivivax sp.]|nr:MAG: phosphoadenosine phosphosulfate reductase [Rubrivivax sp.]